MINKAITQYDFLDKFKIRLTNGWFIKNHDAKHLPFDIKDNELEITFTLSRFDKTSPIGDTTEFFNFKYKKEDKKFEFFHFYHDLECRTKQVKEFLDKLNAANIEEIEDFFNCKEKTND